MTDRAHMPEQSTLPRLALLRGTAAPAANSHRLAGVRREHGLRALLHLRHDGRAQGRALLASLDGAARAVHHGLPAELRSATTGRCCRSCRCSTSMPGALPYSTLLSGTPLVMPGPRLDGPSLFDLLDSQKVYPPGGCRRSGSAAPRRCRSVAASRWLSQLIVGGSAAPPALIETFERDWGVDVVHAWGMTEMSPIGTFLKLTPEMEQLAVRGAHGRSRRARGSGCSASTSRSSTTTASACRTTAKRKANCTCAGRP